jgi:Uma2 family endonuclease
MEHAMLPRFTRSDWCRLPEGFPAQLVAGLLVKEPAPDYGHQRLVSRLHALLSSLVGPDRALTGPADVVLGEHDVYQPDVLVLGELPAERSRDVGIPVLVVEVLSASTATRDRGVKRRRLLRAGVAEVWLVDPEARTIERHTLRGRQVARHSEPLVSAAVPGLAVTPEGLFGRPSNTP